MYDLFIWWYVLPTIIALIATAHTYYIGRAIDAPKHEIKGVLNTFLKASFLPFANICLILFVVYSLIEIYILDKE